MPLEPVIAAGNYRDSLVALRDYLARALDQCTSDRDRSALAARLAAVLADIEAIPSKTEVSPADEIAARRASRHSGAARQARP